MLNYNLKIVLFRKKFLTLWGATPWMASKAEATRSAKSRWSGGKMHPPGILAMRSLMGDPWPPLMARPKMATTNSN